MTRIILHLGPGKCGSSAIQSHLRRLTAAPDAPLRAMVLPARDVAGLEAGEQPVQQSVSGVIADAMTGDLPLVISHEALFKKHRALLWMAQAARGKGANVSALAYVRRQSDFLRSVHAQWLFRMPDRIAETAGLLREHDIDPSLFTGAERHLMAVALGHVQAGRQGGGQAYFDWSQSMSQVAALLAPHGVALQVAALPARDAPKPLIADFMERIGVADGGVEQAAQVVNAAFSPTMIEGVGNAIERGHVMPGPHEANDFMASGDAAVEAIALPATEFQKTLADCIDTQFEARNRKFAQDFGIDPGYFAPRKHRDPDAVPQMIHEEATARAQEPEAQRAARLIARAEATVAAWSRYRQGKTR